MRAASGVGHREVRRDLVVGPLRLDPGNDKLSIAGAERAERVVIPRHGFGVDRLLLPATALDGMSSGVRIEVGCRPMRRTSSRID
jgi:hypothetical protein